MAEVTLKGISKTYPGTRASGPVLAVDNLSLSIADGEFVVLVGPSGCGKTTTLRMVAGLEDVASGEIVIGGRTVNNVHPRDRDIAMVFQNYALYPHMTVRKNMAFALKMRKVPKAEIDRRVEHTARILGLDNLLDRKPRELSGGQRQRVALGRAIVREPKAFLFDEPLSNLDAKLRVSTRAELKALHQRLKTTTIYVTHDQEEAMTLGDRIVVMAGGRIQQEGPPLEVYRRPANRFVASFIGTPPMNFLSGQLADLPSGLIYKEASGVSIPLPDAPAALRASANRPMVMGIRPQGFTLTNSSSGIPLTVNIVEPLGDSLDLSCSTDGGTSIIARIPARSTITPPASGASAHFAIDPSHCHFFEPGDFGARIA
ncbi:MAG: sn-glycerol-3-phosphate ABC transporter ATP-binding protein UgpC [Phycisphaeraceae bacterium]|nr:sn-glycerol-3-phosphate ABC transporter ATP-binding protein UgpC [Phycisphaeraceae bacterium]